jgi:hypothetical protein
MTKATTDYLYVNLSASQTRKRLKGYGFGVRKVEAVDRNQAVIIHTATRDHLRHLESLFADVMPSASKTDLDTPIENLRNLGPTSAAWLRDIGIQTRTDLEDLGPAFAYQMVKKKQPGASINLLWSMAAALMDKDWRELSDDEKTKLLAGVGGMN